MNKTPESQEINKRFIRSFDELRYRGLVKTKTEFCKSVGIFNTSNFERMKKSGEPSLTNIILLHKNFGVSVEWIMLGAGDFFDSN